jgi:hypothetical protein
MKVDISSVQTDREAVSNIADQAAEHSQECDTLSDLVSKIDIRRDWFTSPAQSASHEYPLESLAALFLYKHARGLSSSELIDHLITHGETAEFDLPRAPSQQLLSHVWRRRFDQSDRSLIRTAALHVRFAHDFD